MPIAFGAEFARLLAQALPFFALGLVAAGLLNEFVPRRAIQARLGAPGWRSIAFATVAGTLLPGDACLTMPLVSWLRRAGAGSGSIAAFLVSSPLLSIERIPLTYVLLGPTLTVARLISSVSLGLVAGVVIPAVVQLGVQAPAPARPAQYSALLPVIDPPPPPLALRLRSAGAYGLATARRLFPYLLAGLVVAALLEALLPDGVLSGLAGAPGIQLLAAATLGMPLYLCEGEEVPLALALLAAGASPGSVLAFMIAGTGICTTSIAMVGRVFGKRAATAYAGFFWISAVAIGAALDAIA